MLIDSGRGVLNYHTNWVWITSTFYLEDKRTFGFNLGDGRDVDFESD